MLIDVVNLSKLNFSISNYGAGFATGNRVFSFSISCLVLLYLLDFLKHTN